MVSILFLSVSFFSVVFNFESMFFLCFIMSGFFSYIVIPIGTFLNESCCKNHFSLCSQVQVNY
jgi:predicted PurR-regulated permease PerM